MRVAPRIELDAGMAHALRALSRRGRVEARVQQRARVILLAADGWRNKDIAVEVALDRRQVALWRERFLQGGIDALCRDAPRPGRARRVTPEIESTILRLAGEARPEPPGHWSARALARHVQLSATTIRRVWQRHGLPPAATTARAPDPPPTGRDGRRLAMLALCLDAPGHLLVLGLGPADDASPPDLAAVPLASALDAVARTRLCRCGPRPGHEAALRLLKRVDREAPGPLTLHLFAEDEALPRQPEVAAWLAGHPRFVLHATDGGASWRDAAARFLRLRARPAGRDIPGDGACEDRVLPLARSIEHYLADREAHRRPFIWPAALPA